MAAKCPSPRCSRSAVAACQSRANAMSLSASAWPGPGNAVLAAARTRPAQSRSAATRASRSAATAVSGFWPASSRRNAAVAPAWRARRALPGDDSSQTAGMARATMAGAKL